MCIGIWSLEHPDYALIICANRDEYLSRPTKEAHFHLFGRDSSTELLGVSILSGLDSRAGGTWMGINRAGRVALLTNIMETATAASTSRGHLISSFLLSDPSEPFDEEIRRITSQDTSYAGFNLLLLRPSYKDNGAIAFEGSLITNHGAGGRLSSRSLSEDERRCGSISNGVDGKGANEWPKVVKATQLMRAVIETSPTDVSDIELAERLFSLLSWQTPELVQTRAQTRETIEVVPFPIGGLQGPDLYGTRLSTVLLIRPDGRSLFIERDVWKSNESGAFKMDKSSERIFRFDLSIQ